MRLVTTPIKSYWPSSKKAKVLLLGEWCKLQEEKAFWQSFNFTTLLYPWDDRQRLKEDSEYLNNLYEKYLTALFKELNKLHNVNFPLKFWRIFIGPWLECFIQAFYERYLCIKEASFKFSLSNTLISDNTYLKETVPKSFSEFSEWIKEDAYNHLLYSYIINELNAFPFTICKEAPFCIPLKSTHNNAYSKKALKYIAGNIHRYFNKKDRIVFNYAYFGKKKLFFLQLLLGQFPSAYLPILKEESTVIDTRKRALIHLINTGENEFCQLLNKLIPWQLPLAYVESFKNIDKEVDKLFPPLTRCIVTANPSLINEGQRYWISKSTCRSNCKLFILQHGGNYGLSAWNSKEKHEAKIADNYYSWGWKSKEYPNIKPMPASKLLLPKKKINIYNKKYILWVWTSGPRYSHRLYSAPIASQMKYYFEDQITFYSLLGKEIKESILCRLYPKSYGWGELAQLKETYPQISIEKGKKALSSLRLKSKLVIETCNQTTYLESLSLNIPTIVFWNPLYWELRKEAQAYLKLLEKVGIFHSSPHSAASYLNKIYPHLSKWWENKSLQKAREEFCNSFALTKHNYLEVWKKELTVL